MKNKQDPAKQKDPQVAKNSIIKLFFKEVKGKIPDTSKSNIGHDGKGGHWLETQMGISHNSKNEADLDGYEMKNNTTSKTTFGDWSANYYIYKDTNYFAKARTIENRDKFMTIFGGPSAEYEGRYSWSGRSAPKISGYNVFGQKLIVDKQNNILATYSFSADTRKNKNQIIPPSMKKENLVLARWEAESIAKKVEKKFNKSGWFKCEKDKKSGAYTSIVFGGPINFESWITGVKEGVIFFDSGMHIGNKRPYSNWRADNRYWQSLVIETH